MRNLIVTLVALTTFACTAQTTQYRINTQNGERFVEETEGTYYKHTTITVDTRRGYRECMRRVNVKKLVALNPDMTADQYCRCMTTPLDQRPPECDMLMYSVGVGASMGMMTGYMPTGYGPGMHMPVPLYHAPAGPLDYEVPFAAEPRTASSRSQGAATNSPQGDDIAPLARQAATTANKVREVEERVNDLEADSRSEQESE